MSLASRFLVDNASSKTPRQGQKQARACRHVCCCHHEPSHAGHYLWRSRLWQGYANPIPSSHHHPKAVCSSQSNVSHQIPTWCLCHLSPLGTQCELIAKNYGLVHISTGDILRANVKQGTDVGKKAKGFMDAGKLVPDELVIDMVKDRLAQTDCKLNGWCVTTPPSSRS